MDGDFANSEEAQNTPSHESLLRLPAANTPKAMEEEKPASSGNMATSTEADTEDSTNGASSDMALSEPQEHGLVPPPPSGGPSVIDRDFANSKEARHGGPHNDINENTPSHESLPQLTTANTPKVMEEEKPVSSGNMATSTEADTEDSTNGASSDMALSEPQEHGLVPPPPASQPVMKRDKTHVSSTNATKFEDAGAAASLSSESRDADLVEPRPPDFIPPPPSSPPETEEDDMGLESPELKKQSRLMSELQLLEGENDAVNSVLQEAENMKAILQKHMETDTSDSEEEHTSDGEEEAEAQEVNEAAFVGKKSFPRAQQESQEVHHPDTPGSTFITPRRTSSTSAETVSKGLSIQIKRNSGSRIKVRELHAHNTPKHIHNTLKEAARKVHIAKLAFGDAVRNGTSPPPATTAAFFKQHMSSPRFSTKQ